MAASRSLGTLPQAPTGVDASMSKMPPRTLQPDEQGHGLPEQHLNDPFARNRLPRDFDRNRRVALIGQVALDLLDGRLPDQEARLFVAGALRAWLELGGQLERDFFKVTKPQSHATPRALWRQQRAAAHRDEGETS